MGSQDRVGRVMVLVIICLCGFAKLVPAQVCPESVGPWPLGGLVNAVAVSGDYAFVGSGTVLMVVDVTDSAAPAVVGHVDLPSLVWDVAVSGDHVYLIGGGLHVVDVSDPSSPVRVGSLQIAGNPTHIAVSGSHAFLAGDSLRVIDIVDPSQPVEVGHHPGKCQNITVIDNYAYAPAPYGLRVLDVGDPTSPTTVGFLATDGAGVDIAIDGDWGYLAESRGLRILDLSQPDAPVSMAVWEARSGHRADAVLASESYVYLLSQNQGALIVDVETPIQPIEVSSYESSGWFRDIALAEGQLYLAEDSGLRILDVDPPGAEALGFVEFLGIAAGVVTDGSVAYVSNTYMGLRLVDVSDPDNPVVLGLIDTPGNVYDVAVAEGLAYAADGEAGVRVFDVGNPTSPVEVGVVETPGRAVRVAVAGDLALVAAESAGLRVIDVSVPESPIEVGFYQTTGDAMDVEVFDGRALVVDSWDRGSALRLISLADPTNPVLRAEVGSFGYNSEARSVEVSDGFAYVLQEHGYIGSVIVILDLAESGAQAIRGAWGVAGSSNDIFVSGETAFVAAGSDGLQVVDVSDVWAPKPAAIPIDIVGRAMGVLVSGTTAYVAAHNAGLRIFDVTQTAPIELGSVETPGSSYGIAAVDGLAFLASTGGLETYDLADPLSPALLGRSGDDDALGRLVVAGDLAAILGWEQVKFFDISDPAMPALQGVFQRYPWWSFAVSLSDSYAYIGGVDESFEHGGLVILDISDPAAPLEAGMLETPGFIAGVAVRGSTAYAAGGTYDVLHEEWIHELRVIDVEDPYAPIEVGYLQLTQQHLTLEMDMVVAEPYVYMAGEALWVIDVGDPAAPVEIGFLPDVSGQLELVGNHLLIGGRSDVQVVDVSDPTSPVEIGRGEAPDRVNDMTIHGIYLHAACGASGVQIFDLSDCPGHTAPPGSPRQSGGRVVP